MNAPLFRPFANKYLVLPDPIEDQSETIGRITLTVPKDPNKQAVEGKVVARGKSCTELQVGEKAVYGKFAGYDLNLDGVDYKVLGEGEIFGERVSTPFD
jgi:chaperonin GroES